MKKAVKYSIERLLDKFGIENKYGFEILLDKECEQELLQFIRENDEKFIYILRFILPRLGGKVYKKGPQCTMEMRFIKCGKVGPSEGLNSRIYLIPNGNNLILCYLDTNKKGNKVKSSIVDILKIKCSSKYEFEESSEDLIEIDANE